MKDFEQNGQAAALNATTDAARSEIRLMFSGHDTGVRVAKAVQSGIFLEGVLTEARSGDFGSLMDQRQIGLREVEIPANHARRQKFLAAWSEAARKSAKKGLGFSMLLLPLSACIGDGDGPGASNSVGFVIDGYIKNAFLFRDENGDGIFQSATEASAVTDDNGRFELGGSATASIVVDPSQDPLGRTAVDTDTISSDNPNGDAFTGRGV